MKLNTVAKRLHACREELQLSQAQLAEMTGISQPTISSLESGKTSTTGKMATLAKFLGVTALWLETGEEPKRPTLSGKAKQAEAAVSTGRREGETIEIAATRGTCGGASRGQRDVDEIAASLYPVRKDMSFFTNAGVSPSDVKAIIADGDGMDSFIVHGDTVFVATSQCDRLDNGLIYAVQTVTGIQLRRVFIEPDGRVILSFDNPDKNRFRDTQFSAEEAANISIFGRFIYRQG